MSTARNNTKDIWFGLLYPVAIARFIIFAPLGFYFGLTGTHNSEIQQHPLLHNGTYSGNIATGEAIADRWGTFAFFWNFSVWLPTFIFIPPMNFPFAVLDTVITVYVSMATNYQGSYAPKSKKACWPSNNPNINQFNRPPGTNESFFQAAARLNSTTATAEHMCESYVEEWQYGIAVAFFYASISLIQWIAFIGSVKAAHRSGKTFKQMAQATAGALWVFLNVGPKFAMLMVTLALYWIPMGIFRCLPFKVKYPVRYGRRNVAKAGLGLGQQTEMKVMELRNQFKNSKGGWSRYQGGDPGQSNPLSEFLGIYDMLILVTRELHFQDIQNLSQVSKSLHETVLPNDDYDRRIKAFEVYACSGTKEKYECWACRMRICDNCTQMPSIPETTLFHHQNACVPFCTPCYTSRILGHHPVASQRLKEPKCRCAPTPATPPNLISRYMNGSKFYANKQASLSSKGRKVCRACNMLPASELLALREKRTKYELLHGMRASGQVWTHCTRRGCGKELGTGPRWWICASPSCQKECASLVHGAWGRGVKDEKGEVVIGEQAC